jgi:hypothetical protein
LLFSSLFLLNFAVQLHPVRILLLYLRLFISTLAGYEQTAFGMEIVPASAITKWAAVMPKVYEGVYHFGESEAESDFVLVVSEGIVTTKFALANGR